MRDIFRVRFELDSNYFATYKKGITERYQIDENKPIKDLQYPEFYDVKLTSYCRGACPWCVPPGTMINTPNGVIPIEDIQENDIVLGDNYSDVRSQKVEQLFERDYDGELIELELEDGKVLSLTPEHEVYTTNRGWVYAKDLTETDDVKIVN